MCINKLLVMQEQEILLEVNDLKIVFKNKKEWQEVVHSISFSNGKNYPHLIKVNSNFLDFTPQTYGFCETVNLIKSSQSNFITPLYLLSTISLLKFIL